MVQKIKPEVVSSGKFLSFEGGEGAGKSTQIQYLSGFLEQHSIPHILTREPGGTEGAEEIRDLLVNGRSEKWLPKTEVLLMMASRVEHYERKIKPALEAGKWVICDRYHDSSLAYQGSGHGVDLKVIHNLLYDFAENRAPDFTFFIDIPPKNALERARSRNAENADRENRFETLHQDFHQNVYEGYKKLAQDFPNRFRVINGNQSIEAIFLRIQEQIMPLLRTTD